MKSKKPKIQKRRKWKPPFYILFAHQFTNGTFSFNWLEGPFGQKTVFPDIFTAADEHRVWRETPFFIPSDKVDVEAFIVDSETKDTFSSPAFLSVLDLDNMPCKKGKNGYPCVICESCKAYISLATRNWIFDNAISCPDF